MKSFDSAKLLLTAYDFDNEEKINISLGGLKANPDIVTVTAVRDALNTLVTDQITLTSAVETYVIG